LSRRDPTRYKSVCADRHRRLSDVIDHFTPGVPRLSETRTYVTQPQGFGLGGLYLRDWRLFRVPGLGHPLEVGTSLRDWCLYDSLKIGR
jgi:hypothetical protein